MIWQNWWKRGPRERAREFLAKQGFRLVTEDWGTTSGQVDFVAVDQGYLVLLKIRSRGGSLDSNSDDEDLATDTLAELMKAARQCFPEYQELRVRYDVVRFDWYGKSSQPVLRYFPNAATAALPAITHC